MSALRALSLASSICHAAAALASAKVSFGGAGSAEQPGFAKLDLGASGRSSFSTSFPLGSRRVSIAASGFEALLDEPSGLEPGAEEAALSALLASSLVCRAPCAMALSLGGLVPGARYRLLSYHHSVGDPRGGGQFALQYSGTHPVPLKQSGDGANPRPALRYEAVVAADSLGGIALTLTKGPLYPLAPVNLNGLEIEEVAPKSAQVVAQGGDCADGHHKDFGLVPTLQECVDAVDSDLDCSASFSWCPAMDGRCRCAKVLGNSPNCTANLTDGSRPSEKAACNVYRVVEAEAVDAGGAQCLPGFYAAAGAGSCTPCVGGATRRRRATECSQCAAGFYDPGNVDDCARCAGGATRRRRAQICSECKPGLYDAADEDDCQWCVGGAVRRRRAESCSECASGSFDGGDADDCLTCHSGHTRRRRSVSCTPCPAGYYAAPSEDDCLQCLHPSPAGGCSVHPTGGEL